MTPQALHAAMHQFLKDATPILQPAARFSPPAINLLQASIKDGPLFYGRCWSKLDSSLAFAETALTSPIHLIVDLFKTIISAPFAICSKDARKFCKNHFVRSGVDLAAIGIGVVGTFSPDAGSWLTAKLINKICDLNKMFEDSRGLIMSAAFQTILPFMMSQASAILAGRKPQFAAASASARESLPPPPDVD